MKRRLAIILVFALVLGFAMPAIAAPNLVERAALKSFKLNLKNAKLDRGETVQLLVESVKPADADVNLSAVKWSSSKPKIASVSSDGVVTALKNGTAVITAKLGKSKATCKVTSVHRLQSFQLNKESLALSKKGKTAQLKVAAYIPKDTTSSKKAKWASSDKSVASVDSKGKVTANKDGVAVITCTVVEKTAQCAVTVGNPTPISPLPEPPVSEPTTPNPPSPAQTIVAYRAEVLRLVNVERAKVGVAPLQAYAPLQAPCDLRATEIQTQFSHTRPNGTDCLTVLDFPYQAAGENIASGLNAYDTPARVMEGWMNSPGHRENILRPVFTHLGVGVINVGNRWYWVQLFLKP